MISLHPDDVWITMFVRAYLDNKLDDPHLRARRDKVLRASLLGLPAMGRLVRHGRYNLGLTEYEFWKCVSCGELFIEIDGHIRCNQVNIDICPWCRYDSTYGRFGA